MGNWEIRNGKWEWEMGIGKCEIRNKKQEMGNGKLRNKKWKMGNGKLGNKKWEMVIGNGKWEIGK